jgi:hypothetical protein
MAAGFQARSWVMKRIIRRRPSLPRPNIDSLLFRGADLAGGLDPRRQGSHQPSPTAMSPSATVSPVIERAEERTGGIAQHAMRQRALPIEALQRAAVVGALTSRRLHTNAGGFASILSRRIFTNRAQWRSSWPRVRCAATRKRRNQRPTRTSKRAEPRRPIRSRRARLRPAKAPTAKRTDVALKRRTGAQQTASTKRSGPLLDGFVVSFRVTKSSP